MIAYYVVYVEDCLEVEGEPLFGYMRGRYSAAEIRELVRFADCFEVEVIPFVQTLAHLSKIFYHWDPYFRDVRDTNDIFLMGEEKTYALLDKMLDDTLACCKDVSFATAIHKCYGYAPLNEYSLLIGNAAIEDSIGKIQDVAVTLWGGDGVVGKIIISGTVENCQNDATVIGGTRNGIAGNVGGIIGCAYYSAAGKTMTINNCVNKGSVSNDGHKSGGTGGIVGFSAAEVTNCINNGEVKAVIGGLGGIVGKQVYCGKIVDCENAANIDATTENHSNVGLICDIVFAGEGSTSEYEKIETIVIDDNIEHGTII